MPRFYVTEQLSPRIGETPEGFLVCFGAPIGRTGKMVYNARKEADLMPWLAEVEPDASGLITVIRDADELFRPETIASFEGKPATVDHPPGLVDPESWAQYARGNMQGVRRGERDQADLLLADLLVTDAGAIEVVKSRKKRELSCGYDADYEVLGPGLLRQKNIVGNHVAIVDRGRAGARCVIMDAKEDGMKTLKEVAAALKKMWKDATEEERKEAETEVQDCFGKTTKDENGDLAAQVGTLTETVNKLVESDKEVHAMMDSLAKRFKDEETETEEEKRKREEAEEEEKKKNGGQTADAVRASFQDAASRAEILVVGSRMPTFDAAIALPDQLATLDAAKRGLLVEVYKTEEGKKTIELFTRGPVADFATLDALVVDAAFVGASELAARANNSTFMRRGNKTNDFGPAKSIADLNKRHADFWASRK